MVAVCSIVPMLVKRGQRMIITPTNPIATALTRIRRIFSPSNTAARMTVKIGVAKPMAVTSGRGSRPRPVKVSPIAVVPNSPRQTWPIGFCVFSPLFSLPRCASQIRITGMAKKERKKTDSPAGTSSASDLMIADMQVKSRIAVIFSPTPRAGRAEKSSTFML